MISYTILCSLLLLAIGKVGKEDALYYLILKLSSIRFWNFVVALCQEKMIGMKVAMCTVIVQRILLYEVR